MTVLHFTHSQFLDYLKIHEWEIVSDDHWEEFDFIMLGKEDVGSFPLQIKKVYFYMQVVKICNGIEVPPPKDFLKAYKQHKQLSKPNSDD